MQPQPGRRIPPEPATRGGLCAGAEVLGILADAGLVPDLSLEAIIDHLEFRQSDGSQ